MKNPNPHPELIKFLKRYEAEHGWPPSRREIAEELGVTVSTAQHHVRKAIDDGWLEVPPSPPGAHRALRLTRQGMKFLHPSNTEF